MESAYGIIPPHMVSENNIVRLYPTYHPYRVLKVDVHVTEHFMQTQIFLENELVNAYHMNFKKTPVSVNFINSNFGIILNSFTHGVQEL